MKSGFYWAAHKNYPVWQIFFYLDGKFFAINARHYYQIDDFVPESLKGPIETPNGEGHWHAPNALVKV